MDVLADTTIIVSDKDRQTDRHGLTDRQTDRQTNRQPTHRQTGGQAEKQTDNANM